MSKLRAIQDRCMEIYTSDISGTPIKTPYEWLTRGYWQGVIDAMRIKRRREITIYISIFVIVTAHFIYHLMFHHHFFDFMSRLF